MAKKSQSAGQAKQPAANSDGFVLTIKDTDKVEDLDAGGAEMNPAFSFDGDGFEAEDELKGWDFGAKPSTGEDDELDQILKRHGGLQDSVTDEGPENKANEQDSVAASQVSGESGAEESDNDAESSGREDSEAAENKEDADDDIGSAEDDNGDVEDKNESSSVHADKSGFFDDEPASSPTASFSAMNLSRPVMKGIAKAGYTVPTPIQSAVIPVGLLGKDVVAGAVTGSGKTAAYMIPTLERLVYRPLKSPATRVVVLTPTRELAMQVYDVGQQLGQFINGLRFGMAIGGLGLRAQEQQLRTKPDVVVATPGRFIDHVRNSPSFSVDQVEVLVVDEADRMLEEGFEAELSEILKLIPAKRQTLLFSATMNNSIQDLVRLSLKKPVRLMINPPKQAAKGLVQEFVRIRKQYEQSKPAVLVSLLRKLGSQRRVIVFVKQKTTAHRLRVITGLMGIKVGELHGSLSQDQRLTSITQFKNLEVPVLICTDLASRGLDIPKIEVVVNYELPLTYDVYLHRIGRSARAGRTGTSISLVGESTTERQIVKTAIKANESSKQKMLGRNVDWNEVKDLSAELDSKAGVIEDILTEEKTAKELSVVEKELTRAQNLIEHKQEIQSRPKRTWFEQSGTNAKKQKQGPQSNHQKKKHDTGDAKQQWAYKKTKSDRTVSSKRGGNRAIMKAGARKAKKMT